MIKTNALLSLLLLYLVSIHGYSSAVQANNSLTDQPVQTQRRTPISISTLTANPIAILQGKTIIVTSAEDSGSGTLRQALLDSQAGDTITFDPGVFKPENPETIRLLSGLPAVTQGYITLDGSNAGVILDGSHAGGEWTAGILIDSEHNLIRGLQVIHFTGPGIQLLPSAQFNSIGGNRQVGAGPLGQGNLFSGNADGVAIFGSMDNTILGNLIGSDVSGTGPLANRAAGVFLEENASRNTIGPNNIIAYNGIGVDVRFAGSFGNTITQNSIHDNEQFGINLREIGNMDPATPLIFDFDLSDGTASGLACPSCIIEIFSDDEDEGEKYEGRTNTDSSGSFAFSKGSSFSGPHLTATATDAEGNTSMFSQPTSGESRSLIIQTGNNLPRSFLETKRSTDLADNRIGDMISLKSSVLSESDAADHVEASNNLGYKWKHLSFDYFDWTEEFGAEIYSQLKINPIHDQLITDLVANGVKINYLLIFWDDQIEPVPVGYTRFKTEEEIQRYLDYARLIVRHFKGRIEQYQILHESFYSGPSALGFSQQQIELPDYVNLVKRVVPVIREEDPDAKIVAGSAPSIYQLATYNYQKGILVSDSMPIVDGLAWHPGPYPLRYSETIDYLYQVPDTIQEFMTLAAANGFAGNTFVCDSMFWPTSQNPSPSEPWNLYSEIIAAKYYGRGIIDHLKMGVVAIVGSTSHLNNLPKMVVIRNLATLMAGAKPVTLQIDVDSKGIDIKQHAFSLPNDNYLIALWRDDFAAEDDPGTLMTVTLPGFTDHNVMGIDVLYSFQQKMGTELENNDLVIRDLVVKDYPLILRVTPTKYMYFPIVFHGYGK